MTVPGYDMKIIAAVILTIEPVVAQINGITEKGALNVVQDTGAGHALGIPGFDEIIVVEEDGADRMRDIEVDKIEMMRMVVFEDIGMKRSVDHDKEIIPGPRRKRKNKAIRKAVS